jgi:hypothetical protein
MGQVGWIGKGRNHKKSYRVPLLERPGAICVVSGDRTTYPQFTACVATLVPTEETKLIWQTAGGGTLAAVRNSVVQAALDFFDGRPGWTLLVDDDHVFKNDMLMRLLRHDKDLLMPTVMMRKPPHLLVGFPAFDVSPHATDDELVALTRGDAEPFVIAPGQTGLVEIGSGGTGCLVVSSDVYEAMGAPWFEFGRFGPEEGGEDTWFFLKARRLGFRAYMDLDTPIGHLTTANVWPERDEKGQIVARIITGFDERQEVTTRG